MHDRNPYKSKPHFGNLGANYTFLAPFVKQIGEDEYAIDFEDEKALGALAKALLLDEFQLDVVIPDKTLVPRVPSRMEYILWIEDLIYLHSSPTNDIKGIDIGTGASCVYGLLAAKKNQWSIIATEKNAEAVKYANHNVARNNLEHLIKVVQVPKDSIFDILDEPDYKSKYTFTICNPPYFDLDENIGERRSNECPGPSGASTGTENELRTQGGEVEFITKMIKDSQRCGDSVLIFTSMLGVYRHWKYIKQEFWRLGISNFLIERNVCGKTSRWFIAWSFHKDVLLFTDEPDVSNRIESVPLCFDLKNMILGFLAEIDIYGIRNGDTIHVIAYRNTWTNLRKRKRERMQQLASSADSDPTEHKIPKIATENGSGQQERLESSESSTGQENPHESSKNGSRPEKCSALSKNGTGIEVSLALQHSSVLGIQVDQTETEQSIENLDEVKSCSEVEMPLNQTKNVPKYIKPLDTVTTNKSMAVDNTKTQVLEKPLIDIIINVEQMVETPEAFVHLIFRGGSLGKDGLHQFNQFLQNRYAEKAKTLQGENPHDRPLALTMNVCVH